MKELFKEYLLMIFYFVAGLLMLSVFMGFVYRLNESTRLSSVIENYEVSSAYKSYHITAGGKSE